jgi:hypothetical protein
MFKQKVRMQRQPHFQPYPKHNSGKGAVGTLADPKKPAAKVPSVTANKVSEKPVNLAMQPGVSSNSVMNDDGGDQLANAFPEPQYAVQKAKGGAQPSESNAMTRGKKTPRAPQGPKLKGSRRNPLFAMF